MKIDNEFKNLIPPLEKDEYTQLKSSIKEEGVRDPLIIWKGILIDGHNRKEIADELKIKYNTQEKKFKDRNEVVIWIINNQLGRRNISLYDRTRLALMKEDILKPIAKENMSLSKGKGVKGLQKSVTLNVQKQVAKIAKVSHDTVSKVKYIEEEADDKQKKDLSSQRFSRIREQQIITYFKRINDKLKTLKGSFIIGINFIYRAKLKRYLSIGVKQKILKWVITEYGGISGVYQFRNMNT